MIKFTYKLNREKQEKSKDLILPPRELNLAVCSGNTGPLIKTILLQIGRDVDSLNKFEKKKILKEKVEFFDRSANALKRSDIKSKTTNI